LRSLRRASVASIFKGVPSPCASRKRWTSSFRENTENVYIGIEWKSGSPEAKKLLEFLHNDMLERWKETNSMDSGVGIKRFLQREPSGWCAAPIKYALAIRRKSVTLVHKGNIQKIYRGRVP